METKTASVSSTKAQKYTFLFYYSTALLIQLLLILIFISITRKGNIDLRVPSNLRLAIPIYRRTNPTYRRPNKSHFPPLVLSRTK